MAEKRAFRTNIGGQALIEGIMMRGPNKTAMAVRSADGDLICREEDFVPLKQRAKILAWPVIRGAASFVLSMRDGMRALMWSAEQVSEEEETKAPGKEKVSGAVQAPGKEKAPEEVQAPGAARAPGKEKVSGASEKALYAGVMALGLLMAIGLFTVLPALIGMLFPDWVGGGFLRNLLETLLRMALLVGYMLLVSQAKDIRRVYAYHGAEHKTIACYEAGQALTVENVKKYTRFHPRCGTSFLLMVLLVSMVFFLLVSALLQQYFNMLNPLVRIGTRLSILPFVVGCTYEVNRFVGKHDNLLTRILRAPGLWLQRITTREPDEDMIAVGIQALMMVVPEERAEAEWGKE